jgi:hypothetical protein
MKDLSELSDSVEVHIEERVNCPSIHADNWGTPDCWIYDREQGLLIVRDFKYGHKHVEVYENWQLINYAAGVLDGLGVNGAQDQHMRVRLEIVQPRSFHSDGPVRSWECKASALRGYFNVLKLAAEKALQINAPCMTGDECAYCPSRHACPALQRAGYAAVGTSGRSTPIELSAQALGQELALLSRAESMLKARITGLTEQALRELKSGKPVPGYHLEQGVGRKKWRVSVEEAIALGEMMGVNISKPGVITPTQAIKAGLSAELAESYTEIPKGEVKLASDGVRLSAVFSKSGE